MRYVRRQRSIFKRVRLLSRFLWPVGFIDVLAQLSGLGLAKFVIINYRNFL